LHLKGYSNASSFRANPRYFSKSPQGSRSQNPPRRTWLRRSPRSPHQLIKGSRNL